MDFGEKVRCPLVQVDVDSLEVLEISSGDSLHNWQRGVVYLQQSKELAPELG